MVNKILAIITRLEIEEDEEVPDKSDLSKKNCAACEEQLIRLEELKKASMDVMIGKVEIEISELESQVYSSELEKLKFDRQVLGKIVCKEDKLTALEKRADSL